MLKTNSYHDVRKLCHAVKTGSKEAVLAISRWYASTELVTSNTVLVPVPQHCGYATYMLDVALEIRRQTGCQVLDILKCTPHKPVYQIKKLGGAPNVEFYSTQLYPKPCIVIDNVADTWQTMNCCLQLLPKAESMPFAITRFE